MSVKGYRRALPFFENITVAASILRPVGSPIDTAFAATAREIETRAMLKDTTNDYTTGLMGESEIGQTKMARARNK
jgi:hypothetical protein